MRFTILGSTGYVGRALVAHLNRLGHEVFAPDKSQLDGLTGELGHVIYTIGLTSDFRTRLSDTIDAHVCLLKDLMQRSQFESWLYLSSTRVYGTADDGRTTDETAALSVVPGADALYDLSKLLGEAWCLSRPELTVRVVRLSNVYSADLAPDNFLGSVRQSLVRDKYVEIREDRKSCKDYVHLYDVADMLTRISSEGQHRIYNLASGRSSEHGDVVDRLCALTGGRARFVEGAPLRRFPRINVDRLKAEFGYESRDLLDHLAEMV